MSYYSYTGYLLSSIFYELLNIQKDSFNGCNQVLVDDIYDRIVTALNVSAHSYIPSCSQNFFKYWWCQELDCLKQQSIDSDHLWKAAGRPRVGPLYDQRNKARRAYRLGLRQFRQTPTESYSNDLHEALSHKHGKAFWKCWNSKFECLSKKIQVLDGITDGRQVAENFARHFGAACYNQSDTGARGLAEKYKSLRADYVGSPHLENLILTLNYLMTYCLVCSAVKLLIIKVYQPNIFCTRILFWAVY